MKIKRKSPGITLDIKTIFIIGLGIAIVLAATATILMILPSLASPPVDISGINIQGNLSTADLLPTELAYFKVNETQLQTGYGTVGTGDPFYIEQSFAPYDGMLAFVVRPDYEKYTSDILEIWYSGNYGSFPGSRTRAQTWFTVDSERLYAFFWRSGRYVFGIQAVDPDTRQQASEDFAQFLRSLSS